MKRALKNQKILISKAEGLPEVIDEDYLDRRDPLANILRFTLNLDPLKGWFIAILYFGMFEKLILTTLSDYLLKMDLFHFNLGILTWNPHIEALMTGFVEFPIFIAYYLWSGSAVATLFQSLTDNHSFKDEAEYKKFLQPAFESFGRLLWPVLSLGFGLLVALVMNIVIWKPGSVVGPWFDGLLYFQLLASVNIALIAYTIAQVLIRETLIVVWLRRLWIQCGDWLVVHPYHSDGAGGLGAIGQHALSFFYFVVTLFVFIVMAVILPELLQVAQTGEEFRIRFWNDLLPLLAASYFILIPFMIFLLIWPAHKAMLRERDERLSGYSKNLDKQLDVAQSQFLQPVPAGQGPEAQAGATVEGKDLAGILKEVNDLKNMRAVILQDYATWPINADTKRLFGLTSSLPTVYSVAAFIFGILK